MTSHSSRFSLFACCILWFACVGLGYAEADNRFDISVSDYQYLPAELTVPVGSTVRWVNNEKRTSHSIVFLDTGFESERFFPGDAWQKTFTEAGKFPYRCGPHPEMQGVIRVTAP